MITVILLPGQRAAAATPPAETISPDTWDVLLDLMRITSWVTQDANEGSAE